MDKPEAFKIKEEEKKAFDEQGHVVFRNQLSEEWLNALRNAADQWVKLGFDLDAAGQPLWDHGMTRTEKGNYVFSVQHLHNKGGLESLELLGHPRILEIANQFCGADAFASHESLTVRSRENGLAVAWHQERLHSPEERIIRIDIFLDDANEGSPRIASGTHKMKQDICAIREKYGMNPEGLYIPELTAGDILVYDAMAAKMIPPMNGLESHRIISFEFKTPKQAIEEYGSSPQWVQQRFRIMEFSKTMYQTFHDGRKDNESFSATEERSQLIAENRDLIHSFYALPTICPPAHFCFEFEPGQMIRQEGR